MNDKRIDEVLRHLHPASGTELWHGGASVLGSLRGVSLEASLWKPHPDRHNIWELALHIAYWNYAVWRRLTDGKQGGFPRTPSDWPAVPDKATAATWKADRDLIRTTHNQLVDVISGFDAARLDDFAGKDTKTTYADVITGILMHDTYHVGQIQLLKRLAKSAGI